MLENNWKILDFLTDDDIQTICKYAAVDNFLRIFKEDKDKRYQKYIKNLGRLDKKSSLVQMRCPGYAFELYKKGDQNFMTAVSSAAEKIRDNAQEYIAQSCGSNKNVNVSDYQDEEIAKIYINILKSGVQMPVDIYWIGLKLNGGEFEPERKKWVNSIIETLETNLEEEKILKQYIEDEKKKVERALIQQHADEKDKLTKEIRDLRKSLEKIKREKEDLAENLDRYKEKDKKEKDRIISDVKKQIERELDSKRKEKEGELAEEIRIRRNQMLQSIDADEIERSSEIKAKYEAIIADKEKSVNELETQLEETQKEIEMKSQVLDELEEEVRERKEDIEKLKETEREYLASIKQRFVEVKLDEALSEIMGINDAETNVPKQSGINTPIIENRVFSRATEESAEIVELNDFILDFADNIALNFDNSNEIAAIIVSSIYNHRPIVAESGVIEIIVESISSLIDGKPACFIDINDSSMEEVVRTIRNFDATVIGINGILSSFDEQMFSYVCQECSDKYLFMSIPDIADVKLFSNLLLFKACILDVDQYYTFSSADPLLVGKHDISSFSIDVEKSELKKKYDKYFRNLVDNKICSKKCSIELTKFVNCYLSIMFDIGEVLKRCMQYYFDFKSAEYDEINRLLEKNGWK